MIPIFILFLPFGSILFLKQLKNLKQFKFQDQVLIITIISMSLPAIYAYSIPALDSRFLYFLYPIFCIISLYSVKSIFNRVKKQNIITIIIICGIIIISTPFLEIKKIDQEYEKESFLFSLIISEKILGVNSYYPEDAYLTSASVIKNWPDILVSDKYGIVARQSFGGVFKPPPSIPRAIGEYATIDTPSSWQVGTISISKSRANKDHSCCIAVIG